MTRAVVPARSIALTAEELTLVCEIVGLADPLGVGLLPLDHEDPDARELMLTTSLRSLAGRGLLTAREGAGDDDDDQLTLDAQLEAAVRLLAAPPVGVAVRLTADEGSADLTLGFDGDRAAVLAQRGFLDYDLYWFEVVESRELLASALIQAFAGAPGGTIAVVRGDASGVSGEEFSWWCSEDGAVRLSVDETGTPGEPVSPSAVAERLLDRIA